MHEERVVSIFNSLHFTLIDTQISEQHFGQSISFILVKPSYNPSMSNDLFQKGKKHLLKYIKIGQRDRKKNNHHSLELKSGSTNSHLIGFK